MEDVRAEAGGEAGPTGEQVTLEQAMNRAGWAREITIGSKTHGDMQALAVLAAEVVRLRVTLAAMHATVAGRAADEKHMATQSAKLSRVRNLADAWVSLGSRDLTCEIAGYDLLDTLEY